MTPRNSPAAPSSLSSADVVAANDVVRALATQDDPMPNPSFMPNSCCRTLITSIGCTTDPPTIAATPPATKDFHTDLPLRGT